MKSIFSLFVILSVFFAACVRPPEYPIEPRIEFLGLSKNMVKQGLTKDTLYLSVSFTDGDGDIGFQNNDSTLFIVDTRRNGIRINDVQGLPSVPEQGAGNGITGEIRMRIYGGCCSNGFSPCIPQPTDKYAQDTVIYDIYIKDRAGHESNHVKTPPIYIMCK
jgi:hypothetical protein